MDYGRLLGLAPQLAQWQQRTASSPGCSGALLALRIEDAATVGTGSPLHPHPNSAVLLYSLRERGVERRVERWLTGGREQLLL